MSAMRLLWVTSVFHPEPGGGSGVHVHNCVKALAARGHRLTVAAARTMESTPREESRADGVRVIRYEGGFENPWSGIMAAKKCLRTLHKLDPMDFDAVVCGSPYSDLSAFRWAGGNKLPCLYFFYGPMDLEFETELLGLVEKKGVFVKGALGLLMAPMLWLMKRSQAGFIGSAAVTATLSRHSQEIISGHFRIAPHRAAVISGGADHNFYKPAADRGKLKAELGYRQAEPLILTVRRLIPRTGVDMLVEAMPEVVKKYPRAHLLVAGSGAMEAGLRKKAEESGLAGRISFLGYVSEEQKLRLYQAADVSIVPTASLEGFGLSIAESLACGTPVLGTPVGSIPEILEGLDPKLIFRSTGSRDISRGTIDFLDRYRSDDEIRQRSARLAGEHYSWEAAAAGIERALGRVLGER